MKAKAIRGITGILTLGKEYEVLNIDEVGNVLIIDDCGMHVGFQSSLELIQEQTLPSFLYEDDGRIKIGRHGDTDVTDEWNEYLKTTINE